MASSGPLYPSTAASLANAGTSENANPWVSPGNIGSDNGTEASIVASTFDSPDIGEILVASNFMFSIPAGGTINGIVVEVDRRGYTSTNSGKDFRVQLAKGTAFANLVGNNKAAADIWQASPGIKSYGTGTTDLWGTTWTPAEVNASSFAVFVSAYANVANADIAVDFIRVTVYYDPGPISLTIPNASIALTEYAPALTISDHRTYTVPAASLTLAGQVPTAQVQAPIDSYLLEDSSGSYLLEDNSYLVMEDGTGAAIVLTVPAASLTLTGFAPTVIYPLVLVVPAASLTLAGAVPAVYTPRLVTPPAASLTLTGQAPSVATPRLVTPPAASLAFTGRVPTLTITAHQLLTIPAASLAFTGRVPTLTVSNHKLLDIPAASLAFTGRVPTLTVSDHKLLVVPAAAITLTGWAPALSGSVNLVIPAASLVLTRYAPTVLTPRNLVVPAATLALSSQVPSLAITDHKLLVIPAAGLTLTTWEPTALYPIVFEVPEAVLALVGQEPRVLVAVNVRGADARRLRPFYFRPITRWR